MQDDVAHRRIGALLDYDEFQRAAVRVGVLNALCAAVQGQLMSHRLGERVLLTFAQGDDNTNDGGHLVLFQRARYFFFSLRALISS